MGSSVRSVVVANTTSPLEPQRVPRPSFVQAAVGVYNWLLWMLLGFLVMSQLLGVVWNSTTNSADIIYGQSPLLGKYSIPGLNDEPYSDRSIVCMRQGRHYNPVTVNGALEADSTTVIDTNGSSIVGYRVVKRLAIGIDPAKYSAMANLCDEIALTLHNIMSACSRLGYIPVRDGLRIVAGAQDETTYHLHDALPVLILPFWDNSVVGRFAIPGLDGSACMFRAFGRYFDDTSTFVLISAANRSTRERRTAEWLGDLGGVWRNGWYEDTSGSRWYSDVITDKLDAPLLVGHHTFDMNSSAYLGTGTSQRTNPYRVVYWGNKYYLMESNSDMRSVAIANGSRYGLFLYSATQTQIMTSTYDVETFVSNASVIFLLFRWMLVMLTLQKSFFQRKNLWENAGIGCLSCSQTFLMLPIVILPRLKTTLMAFFSLGCFFEGTQKVFSEAWFVMYPAIAEFVMLYFSMLNLIAMWSQRRVSDVLFGPTLLFFCGMHYVRLELAQSGWFEGFDGRISALITPTTFDGLRLGDFLSTNVALRINGNVKSMFFTKLGVLALNMVPLLFFSRKTSAGVHAASSPSRVCSVEQVLSFRACASAGLGSTSSAYLSGPTASAADPAAVRGYEILRLGYVMLGDARMIPLSQWHFVAALSLTRWTRGHFNYRVLVLDVAALRRSKGGGACEHDAVAMSRLDEPAWDDVRVWQLTIEPVG